MRRTPERLRNDTPHANAFGFLRIVFAIMVIVSHSFALGAFGTDPVSTWSHGQTSLGSLGVLGFFSISGYLVTLSASRQNAISFFWHRALRIFPGYWTMLAVTAFVVCPLVWVGGGRSLAAYGNGTLTPIDFVTKNAFLQIGQWGIHDIFAATPYGQIAHGSFVNGSIWTLIYEWKCYLIIGIVAVLGNLAPVRYALAALAAVAVSANAIELACPGLISSHSHELNSAMLLFAVPFLTGSIVALFAAPWNDRAGYACVCIAIALALTAGFNAAALPFLAYATLWAAHRLPALNAIGSRHDYSYGTYIYGFLVLQTMSWLKLNHLPWIAYTVLACILSTLAGAASWHLIEQRALRQKSLLDRTLLLARA